MKKLLSKNDTIIILLCKNPELISQPKTNENLYTHVTRAIFNYLNHISDKICNLKTIYLAIDNAINAVLDICGEDSETVNLYKSRMLTFLDGSEENESSLYLCKISAIANSFNFTKESLGDYMYDGASTFINGFSKKVLDKAYDELLNFCNMYSSAIGKMWKDNITNKIYLTIGSYNDAKGYECVNLILLPQNSFEKYRNTPNYLPPKSSFKIIKYSDMYKKYTSIGKYNFITPMFETLIESVMLK